MEARDDRCHRGRADSPSDSGTVLTTPNRAPARPVSAVEHTDLRFHPGRVFVVGDLHGMSHALDRLLVLADFDRQRDLVWSLGDLVDRGPYSERCLELLDQPWFRAIRGNHEQLLLDAAESKSDWLRWTVNGGDWALGFAWDDPYLRARLAALPWAWELLTGVGRIGLIHADCDRRFEWPELLEALAAERRLTREIALWSRNSATLAIRGLPGRPVAGADLILVGHTIVPQAMQWGNMWFLDSGAVATEEAGAVLSMLEVHPHLKLWTLPTFHDPVARLWWHGRLERVAAAVSQRV
jgi:serine/threonine protein phosphatase 1